MKRKDMMTREKRRAINEEVDVLDNVVAIINKYFPELLDLFNRLTDLRHQSYVKYQMKVIFLVRLLGTMCEIKSMNEMTSQLNTKIAIENIATISGLSLLEIPHCDTINDVFEKIKIEELEKIRKYLITKLIRGKIIKRFLIRDRYYQIIIDASGLATSRKRYNDNCLVKNKTDKKGNKYQEYSTYVLEAKLLVGNMVFSMGSEFVENVTKKKVKGYKIIKNEKMRVSKKESKRLKRLDREKFKQDCEIKAFKRLAARIKKEYPKLRILISGDALYACKPVFDICKEYNWKYMIRLKEGAIPTVYEEFIKILNSKGGNETTEEGYDLVTGIDYKDYKLNVVRYTKKEEDKETTYIYITNLPMKSKQVKEAIEIGRNRWKIENEGFNAQKNGTFDIGHLYSKNSTAIKVHYFVIQVAHLLRQLLENGLKEVRKMKLKIKEISHALKQRLISTKLILTEHKKIQLRFE